jgi:hypothetical protein
MRHYIIVLYVSIVRFGLLIRTMPLLVHEAGKKNE